MTAPLECADPILDTGAVGLARVAVEVAGGVVQLRVALLPEDALDREPALLAPRAWALTGGTRLHPQVRAGERVAADEILLTLDALGDFSVYTLTASAPAIDPFFAALRVRFRLGCEDPFDCRAPVAEPAGPPQEPVDISYLAKDYASFQQALLDFLPARWPAWTERSEADVGIALLELLCATADSLSYLQDRVANEAFLSTAGQRRSLQGHLDLLGYTLDAGAAAVAWVQVQVAAPHVLPAGFAVLAAADDELVFETGASHPLFPELNELGLYDWGNRGCVLPHTATSAVIVGAPRTLAAGDAVVIEDTRTGATDVVVLTADPRRVDGRSEGSLVGPPLTELRWSPRTPLRRDYPVEETVLRGNTVRVTHGRTVTESHELEGTGDAWEFDGAIVVPPAGPPGATFAISTAGFEPAEPIAITVRAADGAGVIAETRVAEPIGGLDDYAVPTPVTAAEGAWSVTFEGLISGTRAGARWLVTQAAPDAQDAPRRPRLRVRLDEGPLAFVAGEPQVAVEIGGQPWRQLETLVGSGPDDEVFRIELDDEGTATLVFGRGGEGAGGHGRRPPDGAALIVTYRVGGGTLGNVARGALTRAQDVDPAWFVALANPLPAAGGREPESHEHARRIAPAAARERIVAVTAEDYAGAAVALEDSDGAHPISRAGAEFRWTGSWLTATLAVDPTGTTELRPEVATALLAYLETRRLAGYDLNLSPPDYVPVMVRLRICVAAGFVAWEVERAIRRSLTGGDQPAGSSHFFHADNFSFGEPIRISRLFAAVMTVPGVASATIERLAPMHSRDPEADTAAALAAGELRVGTDQIVQVEDDPSFPEHGRVVLITVGGR